MKLVASDLIILVTKLAVSDALARKNTNTVNNWIVF